MDKPLSPQIEKRLEEICRSVRVAPQVDEEIHRELRAHIEDKFRGYLDGSEKLNDDDALLLVERHFGDIAVVQGQLQKVHAESAHWIKRILIVTTLSLLLAAPGDAAAVLAWCCTSGHVLLASILQCLSLILTIVTTVALGRILFRWDRLLARGVSPWIFRVPTLTISAGLASLGTLSIAVQLIVYSHPSGIAGLQAEFNPSLLMTDLIVVPLLAIVSTLAFLLQGMLWIWWTDRAHGCRRLIWTSSAAWTAFFFIDFLMPWASRWLVGTDKQLLWSFSPILFLCMVALYVLVYDLTVGAAERKDRAIPA